MREKILVVVRGGLGNQMFQAAYGMELAKRFGARLGYLDFTRTARNPRQWELGCFNLAPEASSRASGWLLALKLALSWHLRSAGYCCWPSILLETGQPIDLHDWKRAPAIVSGYWQRPAYFQCASEEVGHLFTFPPLPGPLQLARAPTESLVALHVRRGDYANDPATRSLHLVCGPDWYARAWELMRENFARSRVLVFSDDIDWARAALRLPGRAEFMPATPGAASWVDMARMATCNHFIVSNSSYSWWAAYLGGRTGKAVIAPRRWFTNADTASIGICPPGWTLL